MRPLRLLLDRALNRPRLTAGVLGGGAVALLLAATVAVTAAGPHRVDDTSPQTTPAAPTQGAGVTPQQEQEAVPAADTGAVTRLTALAQQLRTDPRLAARHRDGVLARYVPDPAGNQIQGRFSAAGGSGACYVVVFTVGRGWLENGDMSAVTVAGPAQGVAADCS